MNQTNLQQTKHELEQKLLEDPKYAQIVIDQKNEEERKQIERQRQEVLLEVAKIISLAADNISDVSKSNSETVGKVTGEFSKELLKVTDALGAIEKKENKILEKQVDELKDLLSKIANKKTPAPKVSVSTPEVKVPDVIVPEPVVIDKTTVVKDDEETHKYFRSLKYYLAELKKVLKQVLQARVINDTPQSAVAVRLVDRKGKKFIDLSDFLATIAGGGGGASGGSTASEGTAFNQYASVTAASGLETDVASFTVPGGVTDGKVHGIVATGQVDACFRVKVDGVEKMFWRTSPSDRTAYVDFGSAGIDANPGDVVKVTVEHTFGSSKDFQANIFGLYS